MTENEAIKQLQVGYLGDTEELVQAKHIAIKALEKQVPKKPIRKPNADMTHEEVTCPTCRSYCSAFKNKYCNCGQKLDWEGCE